MSSCTPLCDYFAVVGYDPASGLKQERIAEFGDLPGGRKSPLEATYESKVIAHFPAERPRMPFAHEIASLALPQGISLRTERTVPREPSFHSFVVTREDGSRICGCSLIFFEELRSIELRQQIFNAQLDYLREFASSSSACSDPRLDSSSPEEAAANDAENAVENGAEERRPKTATQNNYRKYTTHSLPRKLSSSAGIKRIPHSAVNLHRSDQREEGTGAAQSGVEHVTYYKNPKSPLFISKCLAIVTPIPIIYTAENLLHNVWALINDKCSIDEAFSLEGAINWLLHDLHLPPPFCTAQLSHCDFHLLVRRPGTGELPFFDYPIQTLFAHIPVDKFLKLLTSFLLEQQILIVSKNARNLMLVAECLSALVYPFSWQMPYCPILPHTQLRFLEAPVPWLMGLCVDEVGALPKQIFQSNICLLDIDAHQLECPEDLPSFPRQQQMISEMTALLKQFTSQREADKGSAAGGGVHSFYLRGLRFNAALRDLFLAHLASLFSTYDGYLLNGSGAGSENGLPPRLPNGKRRNPRRVLRESTANFDKVSFLVDQPESVLAFLSAFLETQMFTSFIDAKILCAQDNAAAAAEHVLIFDRKIAALGDRQQQSPTAPMANDNFPIPSQEVEFARPRPRPEDSTPQCPAKCNGFMPPLDPELFERPHPAHAEQCCPPEPQTNGMPEKDNNGEERAVVEQQRRHGDANGEETGEQRKEGEGKENNEKTTESAPQKCAPMSLAHQNWRFVEQLLKETKARTKRILVAKMGNEAVHLGHGHLHLGISGVEENTLVAAFCDLLERIWSHGLKKKQGKSALWNYIIAYHEWERKNTRVASRRSNSVCAMETSSTGESAAEEEAETEGEENSALLDLISSIRRIAAGTLDVSPRNSLAEGDSARGAETNSNWSHSLLRAANVICEKISATVEANNTSSASADGGGALGRAAANSKAASATLPPRPPSAQSNNSRSSILRKFYTPELSRRKFAENNNTNQPRGGKAPTPTRVAVAAAEKANDESGTATYRKFIYKGPPLKAVNNNSELQKSETRGRDAEPKGTTKTAAAATRAQRSASSNNSGWGRRIGDLASHMSEDSLSRLALSSASSASAVASPEKRTPARRSRDLSTGPAGGGYAQPPIVPPPRQRNRSLSRSSSPSRLYERLTRGIGATSDLRTLQPLPNTMAYDLKNIMRMTEIKTDIGFARAFVRLALERKLLYHYLKKLLSNALLLQKMYKRCSFLRCDDEREQFLYHLLSLNAVDFSCFTNTFLTIKMRYEVLLIGSLDRFPASSVYVVLTGSNGCTSSIFLPSNSVQFTFDFKNMGTLSTLRIGHSSSDQQGGNSKLSKWYLDYVLVRNCITAQAFYFRCGRWFGRGIDDGALERLLVAEAIATRRAGDGEDDERGGAENAQDYGMDTSFGRPESPAGAAAFLSPRKGKYSDVAGTGGRHQRQHSRQRWRSPSGERKGSSDCQQLMRGDSGRSMVEGGGIAMDEHQKLEHRVGVAVNALMKHFLMGERDQQSGTAAKLSTLLCSEEGLLPSLDDIFSYGLIQRLFRQMYPWDYIEKVFVWFRQFFCTGESKKFTQEQRSLIIYTYNLVSKISGHNAVGKEGKFHLFVLLCVRDHIFSGLLPLVAWTPVTGQVYEQNAFLRQPAKLSYLAKLIGSLNEFQFVYEKSLTHGLPL